MKTETVIYELRGRELGRNGMLGNWRLISASERESYIRLAHADYCAWLRGVGKAEAGWDEFRMEKVTTSQTREVLT